MGKQLKKTRCRFESAESIFARSASDDSSPDNELIKRRSFSRACKRNAVLCPRRPAQGSEWRHKHPRYDAVLHYSVSNEIMNLIFIVVVHKET